MDARPRIWDSRLEWNWVDTTISHSFSKKDLFFVYLLFDVTSIYLEYSTHTSISKFFVNNFLSTFTLYMNKLYKKPGQYMWPDTNEISLLYVSVFRNFRTVISWMMVLLSTVISKPAGWIKFKKLQNIEFSQTIISSSHTKILICVNYFPRIKLKHSTGARIILRKNWKTFWNFQRFLQYQKILCHNLKNSLQNHIWKSNSRMSSCVTKHISLCVSSKKQITD